LANGVSGEIIGDELKHERKIMIKRCLDHRVMITSLVKGLHKMLYLIYRVISKVKYMLATVKVLNMADPLHYINVLFTIGSHL
jgi:hypothetical protein